MPLIGYEPGGEVPREAKIHAINELQNFALDWMRDHEGLSPELTDMCHAITVQVDKERENL